MDPIPYESDFNYSFQFSFEKNFDADAYHTWINKYWTSTFYMSAVYVCFIFFGRRYMKDRPRFELRVPLIIWSGMLAIFSIFGMVRCMPEMIYVIYNYGWEFSYCHPSYFYGPTAFWCFMFVTSKAYELGDTIFIVLRKQPLIFLHWWHHITVMIYVWYSYTDHTGPGRWFCLMNYTVHSFMYSYYTLKALRFKVPIWVSMILTTLQILQMVGGLSVNIGTYLVKSRGDYCQQSYENMRYCIIMYLSYFVLFSNFFYKAYFTAKRKPDPKKQQTAVVANGVAHVKTKAE